MCRTDALHCDDAAAIVGELDRVRRAQAELEAERTRLLDALRRANEAHQERIVSSDSAGETPRGEATDAADWVERSTRAEAACVLRITERHAAALIREARVLCADLPGTMAALTAGEISYRHAAASSKTPSCSPRSTGAHSKTRCSRAASTSPLTDSPTAAGGCANTSTPRPSKCVPLAPPGPGRSTCSPRATAWDG